MLVSDGARSGHRDLQRVHRHERNLARKRRLQGTVGTPKVNRQLILYRNLIKIYSLPGHGDHRGEPEEPEPVELR